MKKCKFDGGNGVISEKEGAYYVKCSICGARSFYAETKEKAIELWDELMSDNNKEADDNG